MQGFQTGIRDFTRGLGLLRQSGLRRYVWLPILLNALIYSALFYGASRGFSAWLDSWLNQLPDWLHFLRWLLWPLFVASLLLLLAYTFTLLANVVGAPFNGLLAEQVAARYHQTSAPMPPLKAWPAWMAGAVWREVLKLGYYGAWLLPLVILWLSSWIPVLNVITGPLSLLAWFTFSAWMMAIEYCDYPADNQGIGFPAVRRTLWQHRARALGFGTAAALMAMVPVVNFVVMPAAVCGGTLLWLESRAATTTP